MRRAIVPLVVIAGIVAVAVYFPVNRWLRQDPPNSTNNRIAKLTKLVADQEQESSQAVANYLPKINSRIDDLGISVDDLLRQLPGAVQVDSGAKVEKPTHRIVHLRSWHFVPKDLYAIDMKNAAGKELTTQEIDRLHQELLLEIELVQLEHMAVARCLIKHHGLKKIFSEGLAANEVAEYRKRIAVLRDMEKNQISDLRRQLTEIRELMKTMEPKSDKHKRATRIEIEITAMIDEHRVRLLEIGVPGRLLITSEIEEVLPLEDADLLHQANPVTPDGKIRRDPEKVKARRDAQVKAVLDRGAFGLIVLGGSHDLGENVRGLSAGRCEYIRVTTKRFKEFGE